MTDPLMRSLGYDYILGVSLYLYLQCSSELYQLSCLVFCCIFSSISVSANFHGIVAAITNSK